MSDGQGVWGASIIWISLGVALVIYVYCYLMGGGVDELLRFSARISLMLFGLAFSGRALHQVVKSGLTWWLSMNRKYFRLSFCINHLIHLGFIFWMMVRSSDITSQLTLAGILPGIITYALIVVLLALDIRSLSRLENEHKVITFIMIWCWVIFMGSYIMGFQLRPMYLPIIFLLFIGGLATYTNLRARSSKRA